MSELVTEISSQRVEVVDIAKGLGIVLVVFGHNGYFLQRLPDIVRVIYFFHVPLFFFLAGVFVKPGRPTIEAIQGRIQSIVKPYAVVCVALGIWAHRSMDFTFPEYFLGVLYGTGETLLWVPMWFLPALFLVASVLQLVVNRLDEHFSRRLWLLFGLFLLGAGYILLQAVNGCVSLSWFYHRSEACHQAFAKGWPWSADLLPINLGFAVMGFAVRKSVGEWTFRPMCFMVALLALIAVSKYGEARLDLNIRILDALFPVILAALVGIFCVVSLAAAIQGSSLATVLSHVGAASLIVLIFHSRIQGRLLNAFEEAGALNGFTASFAFLLTMLATIFIYTVSQRFRPLGWLLLPVKKSA